MLSSTTTRFLIIERKSFDLEPVGGEGGERRKALESTRIEEALDLEYFLGRGRMADETLKDFY